MNANVVYVGIDVDDVQYHGSALDRRARCERPRPRYAQLVRSWSDCSRTDAAHGCNLTVKDGRGGMPGLGSLTNSAEGLAYDPRTIRRSRGHARGTTSPAHRAPR